MEVETRNRNNGPSAPLGEKSFSSQIFSLNIHHIQKWIQTTMICLLSQLFALKGILMMVVRCQMPMPLAPSMPYPPTLLLLYSIIILHLITLQIIRI